MTEGERPRKDPRTQRRARRKDEDAAGADVTPKRRRINPRDRMARGSGSSSSPETAPVVRIDAPDRHVLAVLETDGGALSTSDRELLGAARTFADATGSALVAAASLDVAKFDPASCGMDRVCWFSGRPDPHALCAGLAALCGELGDVTIFLIDGGTTAQTGRRLAARLHLRPAHRVVRLSEADCISLLDDGRTEVTRPAKGLLLLEPGMFAPLPKTSPLREARQLVAPATRTASPLEDLGRLPVEVGSLPLTEADLILSAGNGVTDWPLFHRLSKALSAAEAGSRVVCDAGHLPRDRQIGVSGTVAAPRAYVALGISGAIQHLQGIEACPRVVAVNTDRRCEMMRRADLPVVGDARSVMAELLKLLERRE